MDHESVAREVVDRLARSGFYTPDETFEYIQEAVFWDNEVDVDPDWLKAEIEQAFHRKAEDELTWPDVTDCDRLDEIFGELEENNILSLQNAGYTQQDALGDVSQYYHDEGGTDSGYEGFCFYHGQDLERVIDGGDLMIGFGDVNGEDAKGEEIGRRIRAAFEAAGFGVEWNGSIHSRLAVTGIKWQRRGCGPS